MELAPAKGQRTELDHTRRMPSLVMQDGVSMQEYYAALAASSQGQAYARPEQIGGGGARPRRNSGSSIMSVDSSMRGERGEY